MKEYRIVIQRGKGTPYSNWTFKTFEACYSKLLDLIEQQSTNVKKEYYVINNFYKNPYPAFLSDIVKYTIECREVTSWKVYDRREGKNDVEEDFLS